MLVLAGGDFEPVECGSALSAAAFGLDWRGVLGADSDADAGPGAAGELTPSHPAPLVAAYLLGARPARCVPAASVIGRTTGPAGAVLVLGGGSPLRGSVVQAEREEAVRADDALALLIGAGDVRALEEHEAGRSAPELAAPLAAACRLICQPTAICEELSYETPLEAAWMVARWRLDG